MQKIRNISDWIRVEDGKAINFERTNGRLVRLQVNAPQPVCLDYADANGETTFLARVVGRDVVEFTCSGEFAIIVTGGDLWLHTVDGEQIHFEIPEAVTFTKLVERRQRNPELELMERRMHENFRRLLLAQQQQMAVVVDQRVAAATAAASQPGATGNGAGGGGEPQSNGSADAGSGAAPADGGSGAQAGK